MEVHRLCSAEVRMAGDGLKYCEQSDGFAAIVEHNISAIKCLRVEYQMKELMLIQMEFEMKYS
jgi:Zn ribbon nucleic-acid-binding protein